MLIQKIKKIIHHKLKFFEIVKKHLDEDDNAAIALMNLKNKF